MPADFLGLIIFIPRQIFKLNNAENSTPMNIETKIDRRIWDAIRNNIENRNFTGAIQDSIYFMSELIRERSGKEGDGASLIGAAFGETILL